MKTELKLKHVVITGLLLSAPVAALAGGGQAFKDQKAHEIAQSEHVRDWAAIDANGDRFISAAEMEAYQIRQRATPEGGADTEPQANLNQADRLHAEMTSITGSTTTAATTPTPTSPAKWNQVEKLYWSLQPSESGGFLTAGAGKFQWQLDPVTQEALQIAGNERVLDSTDLGMHFKHGAGKQQPSNRIYIPGATFTVEIPAAGKHQTTTLPGNLVDLEPARNASGG